MNLSTSLVDIENITSVVPRSNFSEVELANLGRLILKSGGLIKPLVLKRKGIEKCEVVDGHFEYYAMVKAREVASEEFEMIRAFIIEAENEDVIKGQIELLRKREAAGNRVKIDQTQGSASSESQLSVEKTSSHHEAKQIEVLFERIEQSFQEKVKILTNKIDQANESVRRLEGVVSKQLSKQPEAIREININEPHSVKYASMTVQQLKKIAKERGLKNYSNMKKAQLIAALASN